MLKRWLNFDFSLLERVFTFVQPYKRVFYAVLGLTTFLSFISPVRPYLIGSVLVDEYIKGHDPKGLLYFVLLVVLIILAEGVMQFMQTYYANWLAFTITQDIRERIFKKVLGFKLKYYDNTALGTLVTRVISDIDRIADIFSNGVLDVLGDLFKVVVLIVFMFWMNWKVTLIVLIPIPVLLFATVVFKNAVKKAFTQVRNQVAQLNAFVQEHVTGMYIVQLFNREREEYRKFKSINQEHKRAHIKSIMAYSIFFPLVELLSATSMTLLVWWWLGERIENRMTEGEVFVFILVLNMLFRPIRQLADKFNVLQMGVVNAERVFKVIDTDEYIADTGKVEQVDFQGKISFKSLWFSYKEDPVDYVLKDISFEVDKGKKLALVGATGAGKSSIVNLLSRFYEFQQGEISIEGIDIRDIKLDVIRKNIGVVTQEVFLFSDTVFNNITMQDPRISREQVIEAAKRVGAHDFIMRLPGAYDFVVGERGGMLSVGQRQLISFIRAYVHNPKILVLDEATSSVDTESETLIQQAIEKLTENRTSIIIAHRLSTIKQADKILVMDKGEIVESGNHESLLALGGYYKKLYSLQFTS